VASLIAATAALINVGLQLQSAKKLETHRINAQLKANKDLADHGQKITKELERVKTESLTELEETKKVFALELDREKQRLAQQLNVQKIEIDRRLACVAQAEQISDEYRYLIGRLRAGEYHEQAIAELYPTVAKIASGLQNEELCRAWRWFTQLGVNLFERAAELKSQNGRRRLWSKLNESTGIAYGAEFVGRADEVRALLAKEREEILADVITAQSRSQTEPLPAAVC
jgi:hypothetical protein